MVSYKSMALGLVLLMFVVALYFYTSVQLPEKLATHWGLSGDADGYMDKFWGIFLFPIITAAILILLIIIPKLGPKHLGLGTSLAQYEPFMLILAVFMAYLYSLTLLWNLGKQFNLMQMSAVGIGILITYLGVILPGIKRNWWFGIRTPWSLESEKVWDKTHELGGFLFRLCGIAMIVGTLLSASYGFLFGMAVLLASAAFLVLYSYLEYNKEQKHKRKNSK